VAVSKCGGVCVVKILQGLAPERVKTVGWIEVGRILHLVCWLVVSRATWVPIRVALSSFHFSIWIL